MSEPTRREALRALTAAGVASLAGCASDEEPSDPDETEPDAPTISDRWVTGTATPGRTLLGHRATDAASRERLSLVLDGPYRLGPDGERVPRWLTIEERDAGQRYEATLREGLRWSEPYGPMTAEDWVYYVRSIHQGLDNWAGSTLATHWEGIETEVLGDRRFEIVLEEPNVEFPNSPALRESLCLPRSLIEPYVEGQDREGLESDETIATLNYTGNLGPYTVESIESERRFIARRNDEYYMRRIEAGSDRWSRAPYFERYEYRVYGDEQARLQALRSGSVTTTTVPPARFDQFANDDDHRFYRIPRNRVTALMFNQRANGWEPLRQTGVRRALARVIDKDRIASSLFQGYAEAVSTFQPAHSEWHGNYEAPGGDGNASLRQASIELDDALGAEYGYDGATLLGPEGEPVELTFVHAGNEGRSTALASFLERELERLGIAIDRQAVPVGTLIDSYVTNGWNGEEEPAWTAGEYNAGPRTESASEEPWDLLCGLSLDAYPYAPATTGRYWLEDGDMNFSGYVPEGDLAALYDRARTGANRESALEEAFALLASERPADFLVSPEAIVGYHYSIVGPGQDADGPEWDWDYQTWYSGRR
ncbi:ABC transporter substrate-binding protein [Halalkalicoccus subterraneus]|uniref:ABC transporter substrate-binding protein n=1 Tax=Halalkalicoccus subterraneus TaxID=2675002 RepID=UPI000EFBB6A0|nr:ABC transporter substrate-binding protein [Halalkalicoccus subterraneus]